VKLQTFWTKYRQLRRNLETQLDNRAKRMIAENRVMIDKSEDNEVIPRIFYAIALREESKLVEPNLTKSKVKQLVHSGGWAM
jgi:hypothetical protein